MACQRSQTRFQDRLSVSTLTLNAPPSNLFACITKSSIQHRKFMEDGNTSILRCLALSSLRNLSQRSPSASQHVCIYPAHRLLAEHPKVLDRRSDHQSSPQSSFFFCGPDAPLDVFFMTPVPIALGLSSAGAPKLSQKSFRSGSTFFLFAAALAPSSCPSINLLKLSAAPFAPV